MAAMVCLSEEELESFLALVLEDDMCDLYGALMRYLLVVDEEALTIILPFAKKPLSGA